MQRAVIGAEIRLIRLRPFVLLEDILVYIQPLL